MVEAIGNIKSGKEAEMQRILINLTTLSCLHALTLMNFPTTLFVFSSSIEETKLNVSGFTGGESTTTVGRREGRNIQNVRSKMCDQ